MKCIKKIVLLIMVVLMAVKPITVVAEENNKKMVYQISEYDLYISIRSLQMDEAEKAYGITKDEYEQIKDIERLLVDLAKLSDEELNWRGMTANQVTVLRKYDGSKLEDNHQLKSVLATLSVSLYKISSNSSAITVEAYWNWNSKPLVTSIDFYETVAFRWKAYNSSNAQITATYNSTGSYCYATYYYGNTAQATQWKSISVGSTTSCVYSQFHSAMINGNYDCWAKNGYMGVKVTGSNISKIYFGFGYNHGISSTAATVSLDSSLGFNYSNGYEMAEQSILINV